ncbi:CHRD domain-containing protein [Engelhardtia mirabilis]|uniref:CHRD domain protein n=1 Tax=Engelhardtia mirabilis TaxID=2528011 RepID=A0A518BRT9_9BACT|nr:CHRD domain protein [Planctomycetes bacterium Pla133]QDV04015.1 CHRD domain protein [Planctomycetes bacterium Pla86]
MQLADLSIRHPRCLAMLVPLVVASANLAAATAQNDYTVPIDGVQMETPSPGTGTVQITLDPTNGLVTAQGTFAGLMGEVSGVHIHGPALPFEHAPVKLVLQFDGTTNGTIFGSDNLANPTQVKDMLNGLYYVVVHTWEFGGGEIRGQIVAEPAVVTLGSGVNPAGSLTILAGAPVVGTTLTFGIDNPTGSQTAPGTGILYISTAPDPFFSLTGTGLMVEGLGMGGPVGELLISAFPPNPILALPAYGWQGPGTPLPRTLDIPNEPSLIGWRAYAQGLLVANSTLGLTEGVELYFGM